MRRRILRISPAGGKGDGVFALAEIPAGTVVVNFGGKERWIWDIPKHLWKRCFQVGYDRYVVPSRGSFGWYLNHSCEPNCAIRGERQIVTLRSILPGEELTFDYSTNVGWNGYSMDCSCGARACRESIGSYWSLDEGTRRKYGRSVSAYLLAPEPDEKGSGGRSQSRGAAARYSSSPRRTATRTGRSRSAD
jgi:hypothetical protein